MARKTRSAGCEVDMTPMIDVVFQLIIFFIVTIQMEKEYNKEIVLEDAKNAETITGDNSDPRTLEIEISKKGWISIHGAMLTKAKLRQIMTARYNKFGEYPVMIRADKRTAHQDVRAVMDICTRANIWRITFVGMKEPAKGGLGD